MVNENMLILLNEKSQLESDIVRYEKALQKLRKRLVSVGKQIETLNKRNQKNDLGVTDYSPELSWPKKVAYALNLLTEGTVKEIVEVLIEKDSNLEYEETYRNIQAVLARLQTNFKIIKTGKYNSTYKLNTGK